MRWSLAQEGRGHCTTSHPLGFWKYACIGTHGVPFCFPKSSLSCSSMFENMDAALDAGGTAMSQTPQNSLPHLCLGCQDEAMHKIR